MISPYAYSIRAWSRSEADAIAIQRVITEAMPLVPMRDPEQALSSYLLASKGYKDELLIAEREAQVIGCLVVMPGPTPQLVRVVGGVLDEARREGVGRALWERFLERVKRYPAVRQVQSRTFGSIEATPHFFKRIGFRLIETMHWFELTLGAELPAGFQERIKRVEAEGIELVTAREYQSRRSDWARAWWMLEDQAIADIPNTLGVTRPSYEEWRELLVSPISELDHTLIALDLKSPVAVLRLSAVHEGVMNINFTGVASSHRRRGISSALKARALEHAIACGARAISTQNDSANSAIIAANQSFGFLERDRLVDYLYELRSSP